VTELKRGGFADRFPGWGRCRNSVNSSVLGSMIAIERLVVTKSASTPKFDKGPASAGQLLLLRWDHD